MQKTKTKKSYPWKVWDNEFLELRAKYNAFPIIQRSLFINSQEEEMILKAEKQRLSENWKKQAKYWCSNYLLHHPRAGAQEVRDYVARSMSFVG